MNKLIEIQRELVVVKGQFNNFGNYAYRSSEDILLALKPLLIKHEGVLTVDDTLHNMGVNCIYVQATATIKFDDHHYSASSFARDPIEQKGMSAPQCTNSASSFAKKQALSNLFLIDDTAEVPPSAEEQEKIESKAAIEAEEMRMKEQAKIDAFLSESKTAVVSTLSQEELKAVYSALYRDARKLGKDVCSEVEHYYKTKKEQLK